MGEVYRARDEKLDRDVALKVLSAGLFADEAARSRFRKEAKALSRLSHPHVAMLLDFGDPSGRHPAPGPRAAECRERVRAAEPRSRDPEGAREGPRVAPSDGGGSARRPRAAGAGRHCGRSPGDGPGREGSRRGPRVLEDPTPPVASNRRQRGGRRARRRGVAAPVPASAADPRGPRHRRGLGQGAGLTWATDGDRLYYSTVARGARRFFQVPVSGGQPIEIPFPYRAAAVLDYVRQRSALLVSGWGPSDTPAADSPSLWLLTRRQHHMAVPCPVERSIRVGGRRPARAHLPGLDS